MASDSRASLPFPNAELIFLLQSFSLRSRILVLLGLAVLPLVALLAYTVWSEYQARLVQAEQGVLSLAEVHAAHLERTLRDVDALLGELAGNPQWQSLDEASCHTLLLSFRNAAPTVGEVSVYGPDAELLCTSWGILGEGLDNPAPIRTAFIRSVMESGKQVYGLPTPGRLTDRMGLTVGVPMLGADPHGSSVGAAAAMIELGRLQELLTPKSLPAGALVTLTRAQDGIVVARSEDWEEWVGRPILWGDMSGSGFLEGAGLSRTHGGDAVPRLWGFAPIPGPGWVVFVGVPEELVYGPIRASLVRNGGVAGTLILLLALLAGVFHRSFGSTVRGFITDARAAADDSSRRIQLRGPEELDSLAHEFNRTLEARAEAERLLVRAEQDLQEARRMEAVGDLAAGVAHEFNNLLTVIRMENALIQEDLARSGQGIDGPVQIEHASERAAGMVRQLLALGRRDPTQPRWLCPATELKSLLTRYRGEFGDRLNIHLEVDPAVPRVHMDPRHLDQIVRNLVRNAWDALPEGGDVTIAVSKGGRGSAGVGNGGDPTVDHRRHGNGGDPIHRLDGIDVEDRPTCVIQVTDTGPGVPEDVRRRAFDPFFTTHPHGGRLGLGLSTVYGIVSRAGGLVKLESHLGRGTTVQVTLPGSHHPSSSREARPPGRKV